MPRPGGDIQPALVQAEGLYLVRVTGIDVPGLGGEREVTLVMGRDADQASGAKLYLPHIAVTPFEDEGRTALIY